MSRLKRFKFCACSLLFFLSITPRITIAADMCSFSTFGGDWQYDPCWLFEWAPGNIPQISANSSIPIRVNGGIPPYTWDVGGSFSLAANETDEPENTLYAGEVSCGLATITVTGNCGESVSGEVRCVSNGKWVLEWIEASTVPGGSWGGCLGGGGGCTVITTKGGVKYRKMIGKACASAPVNSPGCPGYCYVNDCKRCIMADPPFLPAVAIGCTQCVWACPGDPRPNCGF